MKPSRFYRVSFMRPLSIHARTCMIDLVTTSWFLWTFRRAVPQYLVEMRFAYWNDWFRVDIRGVLTLYVKSFGAGDSKEDYRETVERMSLGHRSSVNEEGLRCLGGYLRLGRWAELKYGICFWLNSPIVNCKIVISEKFEKLGFIAKYNSTFLLRSRIEKFHE